MLGKSLGLGLALVFCFALAACGKDQRGLVSDGRGDGDGPTLGDGDGDGDGDGPFGPLQLTQQTHIELSLKEQAGASCGVEVGDSLFVASSLGDDVYITRTSLPFDDSELSEVTDSGAFTEAPMMTCEAHLAGDRFFVLWTGSGPEGPVAGGFAVDFMGEVIEEQLGEAEELWEEGTVAAAGRAGQLGLLGRETPFATDIVFRLFEGGQELPSPEAPIAACEFSNLPPTLVATEGGFAGAFVCVSPEEGVFETAVVLVFIEGQEVKVARLVVPGQTSEFPVALFPQSDGSVIWAYGAAQQDAELAEDAMIYRVSPSLELSSIGQVPLQNQGLRLAPAGEDRLALIAPGQRRGEDAPAEGFFDYCFLDEAGVPTEECLHREGNDLHALPSGLYSLSHDPYAALVAFTPWDGPDVATERVLFDARNDLPRALYCSTGQCEIAQQTYSNSANSLGYMGYSFLDVAGIFGDNLGWVRHQPVAYSTSGGSFGEAPPLVHGWTGGSVEVLSYWQQTGPLLLSVARESHEVVSNAPELATFFGGLWEEGGGYRVFGTVSDEPHTGFVNAAGELESEVVDVPSWGGIHRCGHRYLNVTTDYELFLSTNASATDFEALSAGDASFFTVLGCTDQFLARFMMYEDPPLQIVSLESGAVTSVPGFQRGAAPHVGVMGERLALFRRGRSDVEMTLVDATGAAELHHLPVPEPFDDSYAQEGWGEEQLLVPQVLDDDMNHVSVIWVAEGGVVYLSSWRYSAEQ